jgi:hypothetical protein
MPSSRDSTVNERDSRLRELKREDGHVLMLEGFGREFLDAAEQERGQSVRRFGASSSYGAGAGLE